MSERDLHARRIACLVALRREHGDEASLRMQLASIESAVAAIADGRLSDLAARFGLTREESDAVALLWTLSYNPGGRIECAASAGEAALTMLAVARLFGHAPSARLSSESALLLWDLVREEEQADGSVALFIDPHIVAWLDGAHDLDRALVGYAAVQAVPVPLASWPVDEVAARASETIAAGAGVRIRIVGADAMARLGCAAAIARAAGLPLIRLEPNCLEAEPRRFIRAQRQAFLDRSALAWSGADAARPWPRTVVWFPLQFVVDEVQGERPPFAPGVCDIDLELRSPDVGERRALWRTAIPQAAAWEARACDALAQRYVAQVGDIVAVGAANPATPDAAAALLLDRTRGDLGPFAQRLERAFTRDDLVVPAALDDALGDIAYEARERHAFWTEPNVRRLYSQGRGLVALFCGPPGTGKTMAAQVIAGELGLDIFRIDLSAILSKWVGETAQNLQRTLSRASERNCVLFFDEADALYGKRVEDVKDAQDRFANMDVSHLMMAIESFDGLVLLATNLKANIDAAFLRRVRYCLEFPRPDAAARAEIWRRLVDAIWGKAAMRALACDLPRIAAIDATGAQLKNACLSAAFVARRRGEPIRARVLVEALDRELAKDGQGLSPRELACWQREDADD
ncbi:MAG: ATP-binding protein [Burkholderiales bacterium]